MCSSFPSDVQQILTKRPRPSKSKLTQNSLARHDSNKKTLNKSSQKEMMNHSHKEHDRYRDFLVTGHSVHGAEGGSKNNNGDGKSAGTTQDL